MKSFRLARLLLALAPLAICPATAPQSARAQAAPKVAMPPGTPPLTTTQQQKFSARNAQFSRDARALQADTRLTPVQKQARFRQMVKAVDSDMLAILTPAQRAAVLKQRQNAAHTQQNFLKQHRAEISQQQQLNTRLQKSITPQQKQRINAIRQQTRTQLLKIQADKTSPMTAKQQRAGDIVRASQQQSLAVLTPTQQAQIKQIQAGQARLQQEFAGYAKAHGLH